MAAADGVDVYTVYVGRLPVGVTEGELINLFDSDGDVAGVRVCGSKCDKDYSFGFVVFHSLEKAEKAIKEKHKIRYKGRSLIVEMSEQTRDAIVNGVEHGSNWRRIRNAPMAETLYLKKFKELCQDFCSKSNSDLDPDEFLREVKMTKFGAYGPQKSQIIDDESISWENIIKDTLKDRQEIIAFEQYQQNILDDLYALSHDCDTGSDGEHFISKQFQEQRCKISLDPCSPPPPDFGKNATEVELPNSDKLTSSISRRLDQDSSGEEDPYQSLLEMPPLSYSNTPAKMLSEDPAEFSKSHPNPGAFISSSTTLNTNSDSLTNLEGEFDAGSLNPTKLMSDVKRSEKNIIDRYIQQVARGRGQRISTEKCFSKGHLK